MPPLTQVINLLHRHATCPVCRQRLGAEEEGGRGGGDEEEVADGLLIDDGVNNVSGGLEEID